ncbi:MAG: hypothetical protein ABIP39_04815 [Polyangiaceae bacterium]
MKRAAALAATLAYVLSSSGARADDAKRPTQDYGVPSEGTTAGDVLEWPLRVILFPLWVVTEFVIRRPLGLLVRSAESGRWIQSVEDVFTFGSEGKGLGEFTILPSALLDLGLKPSVGFNARWKYRKDGANSVRLHFGTWGPDYIAARASDTHEISTREQVFVEGSVQRRLDMPFSGIGPFSRQEARTRYALSVVDADVGYARDFWRGSAIRTRVGVRSLFFGDGGCCGEPNLADEIAAGRISAPGYGQGYRAVFQRVELELDTRHPRPRNGSGLRLEAHEESVFTTDSDPGTTRRSWVKYGGSLGAALDLTGQQRVLALQVAAELADPLSGQIPFTDQVTLGGDSLMPGFLRSRLVDRSATVASLQYTWPIWVYLDGVAHAAVGNVWGERFSGFDVKSTRLSSGIGLRTNGDRASALELLFAVGTEPFDDRFKVDSFRLVVGSHHGF